jgi:hypothetical protein
MPFTLHPSPFTSVELEVAEAVRDACRTAVAEAWEDAGVQGLCVEGRCEVAIGAIERIALKSIVERVLAARSTP